MRKIFWGICLSLCCCVAWCRAGIAAVPVVSWSHQVVDVTPEAGLGNPELNAALADCIDKQLKAQAELPFSLQERGESFSNTWEESSSQVAMVPLLRADAVRSTSMELRLGQKSQIFYKYVLHGQLDLLFCSFTGGDIHFLYDIPVFATKSLGTNVQEGLTQPLTESDLQQVFLRMLEQAIHEQLATINGRVAKYVSERARRNGTMQVTEVQVTSPVALQFVPEEDLAAYKSIVAGAYTSAYMTKHPQAIMLPNRVGMDDSWKTQVAANIQALTGLQHLAYAPEEEEATLPVKLELFKLSTERLNLKHNELSYFDYVGTVIGLRTNEQEYVGAYAHKFLKDSQLREQLLDLFPEEMAATAQALGKK